MEGGLTPWIARTVEQSLQLYINSDPRDPSTSSTLRSVGIHEDWSNVYLPTPKNQLVQVIKCLDFPVGVLQLSDSANIIDAFISQGSHTSATQTFVTPAWHSKDITPGSYLSLDNCEIRISAHIRLSKVLLQVDKLHPVSSTKYDIQGVPKTLYEETSVGELLTSGKLAKLIGGSECAMANDRQIGAKDDQESISQSPSEQENADKRHRPKRTLDSLLEDSRNIPKREPLTVQRNLNPPPALLAALHERHGPAQGRAVPTLRGQTLTQADLPARAPSQDEPKDIMLTQIAPRPTKSSPKPFKAQAPTQTLPTTDSIKSSSPYVTPSERPGPLPLPREAVVNVESHPPVPLVKAENNDVAYKFSSDSTWNRMRSSIVSGRFLSRSKMVIPRAQEILLGKETSYWPPLAGQPRHEIDTPNIPSKLLGSILTSIDSVAAEGASEPEVEPTDGKVPVEPELPADHSELEDEEAERSGPASSDEEEEEVVSWSSSPPRLPPDSSVQSEPQTCSKFQQPSNTHEPGDDLLHGSEDQGQLAANQPQQLLETKTQPLEHKASENGNQLSTSPQAHLCDELPCQESKSLAGSVDSSANTSQSFKIGTLQTNFMTQSRSPDIQVFRTPLTGDTTTETRQRPDTCAGGAGVETGFEDISHEVERNKSSGVSATDPDASLNGPSMRKEIANFEDNSSEDDKSEPLRHRSDSDSSSNEEYQTPQTQACDHPVKACFTNPTRRQTTESTEVPVESLVNSSRSSPHRQDSPKHRDNKKSPLTSAFSSINVLDKPKKDNITEQEMEEILGDSPSTGRDHKVSHGHVRSEVESPSRHSGSSSRDHGKHEYHSPNRQLDALSSPMPSSTRGISSSKKRKRDICEPEEKDQYRQSSNPPTSGELNPNGPAYRAAQVRREFFRQQARKRKALESSREPSPDMSDSTFSRTASRSLIQDTHGRLHDTNALHDSVHKHGPSRRPLPRPDVSVRSHQRSLYHRNSPSIATNFRGHHSDNNLENRDSLKGRAHDSKNRNHKTLSDYATREDVTEEKSPEYLLRLQSRISDRDNDPVPEACTSEEQLQSSTIAFRGVFERFRDAYPEYKANMTRFVKACRAIKLLRSNGNAPHPSLYDDYIIRREVEYAQYLRVMAAEGEDPVLYAQFFDEAEPKYNRRILSVADLNILPDVHDNVENSRKPPNETMKLTPSLTDSLSSAPPNSVPERASGEASPELPYADECASGLEDDENVKLNADDSNQKSKKEWYHNPNTAFKCWARGFSKRDKPLIDENGVPWRSARSEKVISIFKRQ